MKHDKIILFTFSVLFLASLGSADIGLSNELDQTNLNYQFTDTVQKYNSSSGEWENTYIAEVDSYDLTDRQIGSNERPEQVEIDLTISRSELGDKINNGASASRLNSLGYRINGTPVTSQEVRNLRSELNSLEFEVKRGSLDNNNPNIPLNIQRGNSEVSKTFVLNTDLTDPFKIAEFDIGSNTISFSVINSYTAGDDVKFNEDNSLLAVGKSDGTVDIYQTSDFSTVYQTLNPSTSTSFDALDWNAETNQIAIGDRTDTVFIYDTDTWNQVNSLTDSDGDYPASLVYRGDGTKLAVGWSDGLVSVYSTSDYSKLSDIAGSGDIRVSVMDTKGSDQFAVGDIQNDVQIFNWDTLNKDNTLTVTGDFPFSVGYSEDAQYFATGDNNGNLQLYDASNYNQEYSVSNFNGDTLESLDFSIDNEYIGITARSGTTYIAYRANGSVVNTLSTGSDSEHIDFSMDSEYLAVGDDGNDATTVYDVDGVEAPTKDPVVNRFENIPDNILENESFSTEFNVSDPNDNSIDQVKIDMLDSNSNLITSITRSYSSIDVNDSISKSEWKDSLNSGEELFPVNGTYQFNLEVINNGGKSNTDSTNLDVTRVIDIRDYEFIEFQINMEETAGSKNQRPNVERFRAEWLKRSDQFGLRKDEFQLFTLFIMMGSIIIAMTRIL